MQVKLSPTLISILKESFPILGDSFPQNASEAIISEKGIAFSIHGSSIFVSCKFDFNMLISSRAKTAVSSSSSAPSSESSTKSKKDKRDNAPLSPSWHNMMNLAEENGEWYKCLKSLLDDGHILTRTIGVIHKDGTPVPAWYFVLLPKKIEKMNKKGENHLPSNVKNFYTSNDEKYYILKESVVELTFKFVKEHFDATNNFLSEGLMKRVNCTHPLTPDELEARNAEKKAKREKVEESVTEQALTQEPDPVSSSTQGSSDNEKCEEPSQSTSEDQSCTSSPIRFD